MTELEKTVRRCTRLPFAHYRKRIVIILEPGDCVAMRLEWTRTVFRAPISALYRQMNGTLPRFSAKNSGYKSEGGRHE